ncbi:MAG: hypothetical protein A2Y38_17335 [Spirochaetes bacterium GWB1_59_5]|nr:MAG: hypothetical protein A2Y38_17335 [Spirochaetes bacterium GWB1_59_5]
MKQYLDAVREILTKGTRKPNRTGVDTLSTFNVNYEIDLQQGFPLLTTKTISWKNIVVELLWFLSGQVHIEILKKHKCKFWDAWVDEDGRVPSAYGNFWRSFPVHEEPLDPSLHHRINISYNDQIKWAVDTLTKDPMSRRVVISAWAPGNAQTSKLPPCHCLFVFNTQNTLVSADNRLSNHTDMVVSGHYETEPRLCLHLTQRSCDIALGVPYNIASYALLLELFSRFTGIKPGIFAHTLIDAHAYTCKADGSMADMDHVPGLEMQLTREPRKLPKLIIHPDIKTLYDVEGLLQLDTDEVMKHFVLENYDPWPAIPFKVAV